MWVLYTHYSDTIIQIVIYVNTIMLHGAEIWSISIRSTYNRRRGYLRRNSNDIQEGDNNEHVGNEIHFVKKKMLVWCKLFLWKMNTAYSIR